MRARTGWIAGAGLIVCMLAACGDDDGDGQAGDGGMDASTRDAATGGMVQLPDNTTGKSCSSNSECSGGTCAMQLGGGLGTQAMAAPGGYCTLACANDSQCGAGGACVGGLGAFAGGANGGGTGGTGAIAATGQCMTKCLGTEDCRDGYVCGGGISFGGFTVPNTCSPAPHTDQLGDDVAGDECAADDDCEGGRCLTSRPGFIGAGTPLPDGYCSGDCLEDSQCGQGGICLLPPLGMAAGSCYQSCESDADCTRDGYRCRALGNDARGCNPAADPLPDGTTGKACTSDADCGGAMGTCAMDLPGEGFAGFFERWPAEGGYCSQNCMEDSDCGAGGVCLGFGNGTCFATCTAQTDCRDGYNCSDRGAMMGMMGGMSSTDGGMSMPPVTVCSPMQPMMMTENDAGTSM